MNTMRAILGIFLVLALAACVPGSPEVTPSAIPTVTTGGASPTPAPAGGRPEERARLALADGLGVVVSEITVVSTEAMEWPDASLGCPMSGLAYAQVVTPGFRIALEAGGRTYFVHTDAAQQAVVCTEGGTPAFPVIPVTPGSIDDGQPWMPVY
jgi:hypothetical protein